MKRGPQGLFDVLGPRAPQDRNRDRHVGSMNPFHPGLRQPATLPADGSSR